MIVTVGPFPSQLLWNVVEAHPSVLACQHLQNILRSELWRTGFKWDISFPKYLVRSRLPRIADSLIPFRTNIKIISKKKKNVNSLYIKGYESNTPNFDKM